MILGTLWALLGGSLFVFGIVVAAGTLRSVVGSGPPTSLFEILAVILAGIAAFILLLVGGLMLRNARILWTRSPRSVNGPNVTLSVVLILYGIGYIQNHGFLAWAAKLLTPPFFRDVPELFVSTLAGLVGIYGLGVEYRVAGSWSKFRSDLAGSWLKPWYRFWAFWEDFLMSIARPGGPF